MNEQVPDIIVGIPGAWADHSDIVRSIVGHSGGDLFVGKVLMNTEAPWLCTMEIYDRDRGLRRAFEIAGGGRLAEADLSAIEIHFEYARNEDLDGKLRWFEPAI